MEKLIDKASQLGRLFDESEKKIVSALHGMGYGGSRISSADIPFIEKKKQVAVGFAHACFTCADSQINSMLKKGYKEDDLMKGLESMIVLLNDRLNAKVTDTTEPGSLGAKTFSVKW